MRVNRSSFFMVLFAALSVFASTTVVVAQPVQNRKYGQEDKFRQLEEILPTANVYRSADGSPGPEYWQQSVDYVIDVEIDDDTRVLSGDESITYQNDSPHSLSYLWLQLDANIYEPNSDANKMRSIPLPSRLSTDRYQKMLAAREFDGGTKIDVVEDAKGNELHYVVVKTMMRVDLPSPLAPGEEFSFRVKWHHNINDCDVVGGRGGYEYFEEDDNCIYEMAQWFPRLVAYTDATGWQHKQFLGRGEFTLEFGDYLVRITVPADHVVGATGVLQNAGEVLTDEQRSRLEEAKSAEEPMFIVTPDEAKENQEEKTNEKKTWVFHAQRVRDFAFASSRKFIWDAQGHNVDGNHVMAMSLYPNEGEPLWSKYSTHSIIHTLNVYSRYTFDYPYPVAYSVNGPVGGMEYPMICFNGPRPNKDGTYSQWTKYGLISVIIHEVGHNYFPMIVNSDERQWTWMDEGLNTFLQYLCEQEWEEGYPSSRGEPANIVGYMRSDLQVPIMTNSESVLQFGANAYGKPATALNILRETVMGRELFDFAFREYAQRWKFKRPNPADFFRTMEDASGVDLDWFWRGWFYSTDHCDIAITDIELAIMDDVDPDDRAKRIEAEEEAELPTLSEQRNEDLAKRVDDYPNLKDFYNDYDPKEVTEDDRKAFKRFMDGLSDEEKELLKRKDRLYKFSFENVGGLVMPIILMVTYEDGSTEEIRLPAEIWRQNSETTSSVLMTDKELVSVEVDPYRETADIDRGNNYYPPRIEPTRFELYKEKRQERGNPMKEALDREKKQIEDTASQEAKETDDSEGKSSEATTHGEKKDQDEKMDAKEKDEKESKKRKKRRKRKVSESVSI